MKGFTKNQQILDPKSDWNLAKPDEPVFVIRANNWRAALMIACLVRESKNVVESGYMDTALAMRAYNADDIPF